MPSLVCGLPVGLLGLDQFPVNQVQQRIVQRQHATLSVRLDDGWHMSRANFLDMASRCGSISDSAASLVTTATWALHTSVASPEGSDTAKKRSDRFSISTGVSRPSWTAVRVWRWISPSIEAPPLRVIGAGIRYVSCQWLMVLPGEPRLTPWVTATVERTAHPSKAIRSCPACDRLVSCAERLEGTCPHEGRSPSIQKAGKRT